LEKGSKWLVDEIVQGRKKGVEIGISLDKAIPVTPILRLPFLVNRPHMAYNALIVLVMDLIGR